MIKNPHITTLFPGPRPYNESEQKIFYGRSKETQDLKNRLRRNRLIVLTSLPKTGKTSLLRCGLAPDLRNIGYHAKAGSQWKVLFIRPNTDPLNLLAEALSKPKILSERKLPPDFQGNTLNKLLKNTNGLVNVYNSSQYIQYFNLLIVVDPLDELLLKGDIPLERKNHFLNLLLKGAQSHQAAIYVLFSMSTSNLSYSHAFPNLKAAIDKDIFYLHTLNQFELKKVIQKPFEIFDATVEDDLCDLLIEELSFDALQLPKLQKYMYQTWREWNKTKKPVVDKSLFYKATGRKPGIITKKRKQTTEVEENLEDYLVDDENQEQKKAQTPKEETGSGELLKNIKKKSGTKESNSKKSTVVDTTLPVHEQAEAIFQNLNTDQKKLSASIFKSITVKNEESDKSEMRPQELKKLITILGESQQRIAEIIESFRLQGNGIFDKHINLNDESASVVLESPELISMWSRLGKWITEEQENANIYREIAKNAKNYFYEGENQQVLWDEKLVSDAYKWIEKNKITEEWARQYDKSFNLAMEFLKKSAETKGAGSQKSPPPKKASKPASTPPPATGSGRKKIVIKKNK